MTAREDWGQDPAVRSAREVFHLMEQGQQELLARLGIARFDARLRRWRDQALTLFERAWAEASRSGQKWGAREAADSYGRCLARVIAAAGIDASASDPQSREGRP